MTSVALVSLVGCITATSGKPLSRPIVILFENDVHCGIDGYTTIAGLRDSIMAADTAFVAVVSSGDYIQGGATGTLSKGQSIIDILNAVHYDAVTIGNHEFDYGTPRLLELTSQLNAPITCVNFSNMVDGTQYYAPYVIKDFDGCKLAFVGVLTPSTLHSESSAFYDAEGKQMYDLHADQVYSLVQQAVDAARSEGARFVIVLSHLGEVGQEIVSGGLISRTTGIDALLDGHTHSVIPGDTVLNREGQPVLMAQTGTRFANIGKLLISKEGKMSVELLPTSEINSRDSQVDAVLDSISQVNRAITQRVCGINDQLLTISDAQGKRLVRRGETNLSDLVSDAYLWFGSSDLSMVNGGGIRADLPKGEINYGNIVDVQPFENQLCVYRVSGSMLYSILELACAAYPAESGMFIQPGGFRYTIRPSDEIRVSDVEVYNPTTRSYSPICLDHEYTVTTSSYLASQYNGLLMNCEVTKLNIGADNEALYQYIVQGLQGHIDSTYAHAQSRIIIH